MTNFKIKYLDTIGFNADQGGRGFHLPTDMVIRDDGVIFVVKPQQHCGAEYRRHSDV